MLGLLLLFIASTAIQFVAVDGSKKMTIDNKNLENLLPVGLEAAIKHLSNIHM